MNFIRLNSMLVLLCLFFGAQRTEAQCTFTLSAVVSNVNCQGANNGAIDLTVTGSTAPYSYQWSNGQIDEDLVDVPAGLYLVTVTDNVGCAANLARQVTQPAPLTVSVAGNTINCFEPYVDIIATAQGGIAPYLYLWSAGTTGNPLTTNVAGTYTVTVVDGNSCQTTATGTVGVDTIAPVADAGPDRAFDCQTAQVVLGGNGSSTGAGISYSWSGPGIIPGAGGNSLDQFPAVNVPGSYTFWVDASNGCFGTDQVIVTGQAPPIANAGPDLGIPCGSSVVTLDGAGSSTGPNFTYQWTTVNGNITSGNNTLHPVVDQAGTYKLVVSNTQTGCTKTDVVKVFAGPIIPQTDFFLVDVSCTGQLGSASVTMSQGSAPYQYLWSNGSTQSSIVNIFNGTYTVEVTDALGCHYYGEVQIKNISTLTLSTLATSPSCNIGNDGTIDLTATSVFGPILYLWNNSATTQDLDNLPVGFYTVTVTYAGGTCTQTASVTVTNPPGMTLNTVVTDAIPCAGTLGHIDLTVVGGTAPYTYIWSDGETTQDASPQVIGTFTVTVIDALGCSVSIAATIGNAPAFTLSTVVTNVTCPANCDGTVDLTVTGGIAPFIYSWSDGSTTEDVSWLCPGIYNITVTDATGCTNSLSLLITASPSNILLSTTYMDAACTGACTGWIDLSVSGGVTPYEYFWSPGPTTQDLAGLCPGTYTVTVADATGCREKIITVILAQTSNIVLTAVPTNTVCNGNNGSINLTVSGGSSPYVYSWTTGATTQNILNGAAGTYTVTVTDSNGCTKTTSAVIGQTSNLTLTTLVTDVSCAGNDGGVDLTVTGGTPAYTYIWSNGHMIQDCFVLNAGTYTVTVTDAAGCTKTASATVGQSSAINATAIPTNATCNGNDGSINLTVTGGTPPYIYIWSDGNTQQNCIGIPAGTYTVTITDAALCTKTVSATVGQASTLALSSTVTHVLCFGGNNGSINLTTTGGSTPYIFSWSDGAITEDRSNLVAGIYTVTVTDANLCTKTLSIPVSQPTDIVVSETHVNVLCNGATTGSIDLTVTGGTNPYTYIWNNGNTTQDRSNLVAGAYTVTVTDVNFCTKSIAVTIVQPTSITMTDSHSNITCNGDSNGSIDLTVGGGTSPYSYLWNNNSTQQDITGLTAGTYTVTVTDANGCTKFRSIILTQPSALVPITNAIPVLCFGGSDGAIDISVSGGVSPYTYLWNNNATTQDLLNLVSGVYTVTITDVNNCTKTASSIVTQPPSLSFTIVSLSSNCSGETITGPNLPGLSYQWSGPNSFSATTPTITAVNVGLYSLTITNASNCSATNDYNVFLSGGACGAIKGRVFHDEDESCSLNFGEPGLAGWIVRAEGANDTLYGVTNTQGRYLVGVPSGTYVMKVLVPNGLWSVCPGGAPVTVGMANDTVFGGDFPVQSLYNCPALTVSIGTSQLRRCFADNFYQVEYCNQGTQKATDAYINVVLDPYLTPITASIPYTDFGANVLHFELGDLDVGECGMFNIQVSVNCNASIGQTHCTEANIYPDTLCAPTSINWSGASLSVQSTCSADSLRFVIRNDGKAGMSNSAEYIVVEDGIMFRSGTLLPLAKNDSMLIAVPANGSTWRVEVGQESFHPYPSPVGLSVEGCTANASFTTGFVNQFPYNDESPTVDVDCTVNIGSFDPNDKYGYPVGYGADHYVRPGTDIEYLIRFQNTGTDTAFTVKVIDTLSIWLDPATIRFGASSHAYRYDLDGEGVVHFIFENILLPDSNTNVVASQGFAKFNIKPRSDAPLETLIENTAAIYFDFNEPVYTNTTFHRLGENFVTVGLWQPAMPDAQISAVPNPFNEETRLELKGLRDQNGLHLEVYDLQGRLVQEMDAETPVFHLKREDWQAGVYLFKITQNGRLVGNGKLVAD